MATNTINTRIKNRYDVLSAWEVDGVELLQGEIALVRVETQQLDPETNKVVNVPAVLMKVGESDDNGQPKAFSSLPWLSAKAADVYNWAKKSDAKDIPVNITVGSGEDAATHTGTLGSWLARVLTTEAEIARVDARIDTTVTDAIKALAFENSGEGAFVKSVTLSDDGTKVTVTKGNITATDIPELPASKIVTAEASGEAAKQTLDVKLAEVDAKFASLDSVIAGGVHFIGEVTAPADLSKSLETKDVTIDGKTHTASDGDIVIQNDKEFIWSKDAWKELGDLSRVGTVETAISGLVSAKADGKFVTHITKGTDGKFTVNTAQPSADDVKYGESSTVGAALANLESTYIRVHENKLYAGTDGSDMIIFDCGGAAI